MQCYLLIQKSLVFHIISYSFISENHSHLCVHCLFRNPSWRLHQFRDSQRLIRLDNIFYCHLANSRDRGCAFSRIFSKILSSPKSMLLNAILRNKLTRVKEKALFAHGNRQPFQKISLTWVFAELFLGSIKV